MAEIEVRPNFPEPNRRDILRLGSAAALGLGLGADPSLAIATQGTRSDATNCILLFLVGGPSHLDTWDLKPDAPAEIRGPFRPIQTRVPGIVVGEMFPRLATVMDKVALIRGVHHQAVPVHDTGHQLMQTGRLADRGIEHPHFASVLAYLDGRPSGPPRHVILPGPIGSTGGNMTHGQGAGYLGPDFEPLVIDADPNLEPLRVPGFEPRSALALSDEPRSLRDRYGRTKFGQRCLLARRLVERGAQFVTVNMYQTVFGEPTWDCHGAPPFTPLDAYRTTVGPTFDLAYASLLEDLDRRGLLDTTMVLAFGEFGRTPRINRSGGRDHHPGCWTVLMAGGPIRGGQVVGASDAIGSFPRDRPVTPAEIAATVYAGLGLDLDSVLPGPGGCPIRLVDRGVEPIRELF